VIVFGSSHGANHGPVVLVPLLSLPPRSLADHSEPDAVKWNEPQLLIPTAPTLRASTFSNVADPPARALTTEVPVPSTCTSALRGCEHRRRRSGATVLLDRAAPVEAHPRRRVDLRDPLGVAELPLAVPHPHEQPDRQPLSVRLPAIQAQTQIGVLLASMLIAALVPLLGFLIFQRTFLRGTGLGGALKG
jgi:hypothetical protein